MSHAGLVALWIGVGAGVAAMVMGVLEGLSPRPRAGGSVGLIVMGVGVTALAYATWLLGRALLTNDYSLVYVADFSRRGVDGPLRLAALWGGMAGSLLFFTTMLGTVGALAALLVRHRRARGLMVAITGGLVAALSAVILTWANPFRRLAIPALDGGGLAPVLEHPAMLYHPPLLYLGLTSLLAPFALAVACVALGPEHAPEGWPDQVRRLLLVPWTFLVAGMASGAHWAYVVLGWGGYWAWDPVENTSLLPWLAVTLALHARGLSRRGMAALTTVAFVLSLIGALLTRSGAVGSVHSFAEDRMIGRALTALTALVVVGLVAVFVARREHRSAGPPGRGRARLLLIGHLGLVGTALAIVFVGTVTPLVTDLRSDIGVGVQGRFYTAFLGPLAVVGLVLVALVPLALSSRRDGRRAVVAAVGGAVVAMAVLMAAGGDLGPASVLLAGAAGAAVGASGVALLRQASARGEHGGGRHHIGAHLAHLGLGLVLLGVAGATTGVSHALPLRPGDTVTVAGHEVIHRGVQVTDGPAPGSSSVVAEVRAAGRELRPSLDAYPARGVLVAEASLVSTPLWDVQVSLRDADDDGTALLVIGVHPLQVFVWWGGIIVAGSGLLLLYSSRRRRLASSSEPSVSAGASSV